MADLSIAALQSANASNTSTVWMYLIRIKDSSGNVLLRLAINNESVVSRGDTYLPLFVDVQVSERDGTQPARVTLTLDAVDRTVLAALATVTSRPRVDIELVVSDDFDTPIEELLDLELTNIRLDGMTTLTGQIQGPPYFRELVPGILMDPANTPAIFP